MLLICVICLNKQHPSISQSATGILPRLLIGLICSKEQNRTPTLNHDAHGKIEGRLQLRQFANSLTLQVGYSLLEPNRPTYRTASFPDRIFEQTSGEPSEASHPVCLLPLYFAILGLITHLTIFQPRFPQW